MRVLLLNPPFFRHYSKPQRSPAVTKSGTFYYPIWLAYAAGVLLQEQHEVLLLDAPAQDLDLETTLDRVRSFQPQVIAVDTSTPSIHNNLDVVNAHRKSCPDAFLVMVGTHISALPDQTLTASDALDAVTRREYDYTLRDLVSALSEGSSLDQIPGLTYRQNGEIRSNPDWELIENLDELPHVVDIYARYLKSDWYFNPNPKAVFFEDDTFVVDKNRTRELCQAIIDSSFNLTGRYTGT